MERTEKLILLRLKTFILDAVCILDNAIVYRDAMRYDPDFVMTDITDVELWLGELYLKHYGPSDERQSEIDETIDLAIKLSRQVTQALNDEEE